MQPRIDELAGRVARQVLDTIGLGVWLLAKDGSVLLTNDLAQRECERAATLILRNGMVFTAQPAQQKTLARALVDAASGQASMLQLGNDGQSRMYAAVPLKHLDESSGERPVLLLGGRVAADEPTGLALFARALGLTDGERGVLECLCDGLVIHDIALRRSVKVSTVRSQIVSIREKLGVRTVPQLMARVSNLPPLAGTTSR